MHFVLNTTLPPYGVLFIDYGWSILPFGMSFQANDVFGLLLNDLAADFVEDYVISVIGIMIIQRIAAGLAGRTIAGIALAIAGYIGFSLFKMLAEYAINGNNPKTWLIAFLSSAIACFLDSAIDFLKTLSFLTAIGRRITGAISHTLNSMWARGLNFFDITGVAFNFIDYAIMICYLRLYKGSLG